MLYIVYITLTGLNHYNKILSPKNKSGGIVWWGKKIPQAMNWVSRGAPLPFLCMRCLCAHGMPQEHTVTHFP